MLRAGRRRSCFLRRQKGKDVFAWRMPNGNNGEWGKIGKRREEGKGLGRESE